MHKRKFRRSATVVERPRRAPSPMGERILKGHFDGLTNLSHLSLHFRIALVSHSSGNVCVFKHERRLSVRYSSCSASQTMTRAVAEISLLCRTVTIIGTPSCRDIPVRNLFISLISLRPLFSFAFSWSAQSTICTL
ncbi:hypothetical protein JVT61DRAFT_4457 [Boletus reticuloceps]|uniref:Uncharacterized protein n=1 Tax=Boletus reticuloceps TaxID=495285 RepID=A0A8I3A9D9_9AGAM|nr:hypothetical protein JVT61DRAFT_4457 [Boletus reticuloceps]